MVKKYIFKVSVLRAGVHACECRGQRHLIDLELR